MTPCYFSAVVECARVCIDHGISSYSGSKARQLVGYTHGTNEISAISTASGYLKLSNGFTGDISFIVEHWFSKVDDNDKLNRKFSNTVES